MFKKALEYAGEYRKTTYAAIAGMFTGLVATMAPFFLAYLIIRPFLRREPAAFGFKVIIRGEEKRVAPSGISGARAVWQPVARADFCDTKCRENHDVWVACGESRLAV